MVNDARANFFTPLLQKPPPEQVHNANYLLKMMHRNRLKLLDVIVMLKKMGATAPTKTTERARNLFEEEMFPQDPEENRVWVFYYFNVILSRLYSSFQFYTW